MTPTPRIALHPRRSVAEVEEDCVPVFAGTERVFDPVAVYGDAPNPTQL